MVKQVIIIRTDLNMRKGKMCSQVAHASMKVFFDRMDIQYKELDYIGITDVYANLNSFNDKMFEWMNSSFTKIVVGCNSEKELFDLQKQANEANIVNAIIQDNGNTEFKEECPECQGMGVFPPCGHPGCYNHISHSCEGCGRIAGQCNKCFGIGKINKPTYTCLAIGPDEAEKIDKITGELKLL